MERANAKWPSTFRMKNLLGDQVNTTFLTSRLCSELDGAVGTLEDAQRPCSENVAFHNRFLYFPNICPELTLRQGISIFRVLLMLGRLGRRTV
jgi:hypothetical protein